MMQYKVIWVFHINKIWVTFINFPRSLKLAAGTCPCVTDPPQGCLRTDEFDRARHQSETKLQKRHHCVMTSWTTAAAAADADDGALRRHHRQSVVGVQTVLGTPINAEHTHTHTRARACNTSVPSTQYVAH